jgi:site-specific recombinase XerD
MTVRTLTAQRRSDAMKELEAMLSLRDAFTEQWRRKAMIHTLMATGYRRAAAEFTVIQCLDELETRIAEWRKALGQPC